MSRRRLTWILGILAAMGPLSIDTSLPAFPSIARSLGTTIPSVQLTLAAYLAGIVAGQLVHGPVSDRLGRRSPLVAGLGLYAVASVAGALAPTLTVLWGARFAQGVGACAAIVVSRAIVRDSCDERGAAALYSSRMLVSAAAPILAPLLGGYIVASFGWRAIFAILAAAGLLLALVVHRALRETLDSPRTKARGVRDALRGVVAALRDRRFGRLSLVGGAGEGALFACLSGGPLIFIEGFGMSAERFGLVGAGNGLALAGASLLNRRLVRVLGVSRALRVGTLAAVLSYGALALAVHARAGMTTILAAMIAGVSTIGVVLPNATAAAMDVRAERAGSASAALGILQSTCGVLASTAVSFLSNGTAGPMSLVMLACSAVAFALVRAERAAPAHEGGAHHPPSPGSGGRLIARDPADQFSS